MDLLPAEANAKKMKRGFRSLKLVNVDPDDRFAEADQPFAMAYGSLDNGLTYYVRPNSKPRMRAALALVVNAGEKFDGGFTRDDAEINRGQGAYDTIMRSTSIA